MGNPVMKIVDVEEGSIKLTFEASSEDIERIQALIESKELSSVLDIPIKRAFTLEEKDNVSQKSALENSLEVSQRLSSNHEGSDSHSESVQETISRYITGELSESRFRDLMLRDIKLSETALEHFKDLLSTIIQSVSIVSGAIVSVYLLNSINLNKEWPSFSSWLSLVWNSSCIVFILLCALFLGSTVLLSIKSRTIFSFENLETPLARLPKCR